MVIHVHQFSRQGRLNWSTRRRQGLPRGDIRRSKDISVTIQYPEKDPIYAFGKGLSVQDIINHREALPFEQGTIFGYLTGHPGIHALSQRCLQEKIGNRQHREHGNKAAKGIGQA